MGKKRRQHPVITAWAKEIGAKGGRATARSLPEAERKAISTRGGHNRWAGMTAEERAREMARVRATRWLKKGTPAKKKRAKKK
jgi:hypothetical protein